MVVVNMTAVCEIKRALRFKWGEGGRVVLVHFVQLTPILLNKKLFGCLRMQCLKSQNFPGKLYPELPRRHRTECVG